jgi:hypothetical protein
MTRLTTCERRSAEHAEAAPLRPLPDGVTDLDHFPFRRHDRAGGVPCAQLISLVTSCPTLSAGSGDPPDGREIAGASRVLYGNTYPPGPSWAGFTLPGLSPAQWEDDRQVRRGRASSRYGNWPAAMARTRRRSALAP